MYMLHTVEDTVRVPPSEFGDNMSKNMLNLVRKEYEGILDEDLGIVVTVTGVTDIGEGKIVPGDAAAYYTAKLHMLMYKPQIHEVTEGIVSEVTEFGAFVKIGPIEGLIHVSQIMDDYINYDEALPGFSGKDTTKVLKVKDPVLARIVSVSIKDSISNSKIGLTMRQLGLGKEEWLKIDEKKAKEKKDKAAAGKKNAGKDKGEGKDGKKGGK